MKMCSKCGKIKPFIAFHVNRASKDGRRPDCRDCLLSSQEKTRNEDIQKHRDICRNDYLQHHSRHVAAAKTPAAKARHKLSYAVKIGTIEKPDSCEKCGGSGVRIDGHHEDYSRPLNVEWLCPKCHGRRHRGG